MVLKQYLKEKNISIRQMSIMTNIPYTTLNDIVNNRVFMEDCQYKTLKKIADFVNLSIDDLVYQKEDFQTFRNKLHHRIKVSDELDLLVEVLEHKEIDYYYKLSQVLVSDIQDKKLYDKLVNKFKKVNDNTYQSISEIKYDPNDIDKERFLLSMNDGNYVYVTMSKFDNINDYLEISKTLGTKNGILYLDYGNYFVPKE